MENKKEIKGGAFMVQPADPQDIFIPDEFDEEQKMIAQTCQDFLDTEVFPVLDRIDNQEEGLIDSLLTKAGEMGLLGISLPEEYEGFDQSFVTAMLSSEVMGSAYSYAVAYSCHTGIGSLPIAYYGNEKQKEKYLPKLATGEWKGAYCLTEPGAGSDANAGKTQAVLSEDGKHYILNGQKMWITNSGFADVFTVFAKIDNDRVLSAFIVERSFPGIVFNPEEKKMGIKGSSTRQIFFNDVKVPVENLLAKRGQGYRIALNILHMGRLKLGGSVIGAAKRSIMHAVNYATERKQFGMLISNFGSIKHKLAQQVILTYATESTVYRASGNVDELTEIYMADREKGQATVTAFAQLAIEAAAMKVFGSESLDYVVDETLQIYGGMGYSAEMPAERAYRDSRINRIFEGTNEINRILIVDTILKRAQRKEIPLYVKAEEVYQSLSNLTATQLPESYFERKQAQIEDLKKVGLTILWALVKKFERKWVYEQEILNNISDIIMQIYVTESVLLRVWKLEKTMNQEALGIRKDILNTLLFDSTSLIQIAARNAVNSFAEGDEYRLLMNGINQWTQTDAVNCKEARRRIADQLIEDKRYAF